MTVVTEIGALLGMILGTAGFTLSLMIYLRDRPKIRLSLQWDMTETKTGELYGIVRVTNIGRRPVFVSAVALELPRGLEHSHLLLNTSIIGVKLCEGDQPAKHIVSYSRLCEYSKGWRDIRAYAEDSTGTRYFSDFPRKDAKPPSWVKTTKSFDPKRNY